MSERYFPGKRVDNSNMGYFPKNPNYGYSWTQDLMNQRASALYYKTSVGKMLIDALVRYTVGKGLTPMCAPEVSVLGWSKERVRRFQNQSEAYWRLMTGKNYDYNGKDDFCAKQRIAARMIFVDGDVLRHLGYRKLRNGLVVPYIQLIGGRNVVSPDHTDTKKIIGGVEIDGNGREIAYHISVINDDLSETGSTVRVNRRTSKGRLEFDLIQLQKSEDSMVRGLPILSNLREDIFDYNSMRKNHLDRTAVQNMFTAFVESEKDTESNWSFKDTLESGGARADVDITGENKLTMGPGYIIDLEPGKKVNLVQSQTNGEDFSAYEKSMIGLMASSLGMSYEIAMNTFNASFSASRASLSGAEKNFAILRNEFADKFCTPAWEQMIEFGILSGGIDCPEWDGLSAIERKALLSVTWTGVTPPQVDPTKEVKAYIEAVKAGLCSREHAVRSLFGFDFEEVAERLKEEAEMLSETNAGTQQEQDENNSDSDSDSDKEDKGEDDGNR